MIQFQFSLWTRVGIFLSLILLVSAAPQHSHHRSSGDYSVTHLDIRDAVLSLVRVLQDQMDKLERHEGRERQLGEHLSRGLSLLDKRARGQERNFENIASYLGRMEEKVKLIQGTVEKQSDERRVEHEVVGLGIKSLKQTIAERSHDSDKLERKLDRLSETIATLREGSQKNSAKFDSLMELWQSSSTSNGLADISEVLMTELADIKDSLSRTAEFEAQVLASTLTNSGQSDWQGELMESMDSQKKQLALLEEEIGKALRVLGDMTESASGLQTVLGELGTDTSRGFEALGAQVDLLRETQGAGGDENATLNHMDEKLNHVQEILKSGQKHLEEKVKLAETAVEGLYSKMENGYGQLAEELKGLSNVESVLLDTGDSVMETKRRLEYGVQQIMGEMNAQLKEYTSNLNTSLQHRFDGLATAVLGNQSRAITNLTSRMEEDISQVWRQIGTLYQEMSRSANLLDTIHSQTSKYVNNSLDTMSSMDGKVGQITNRMGEVDDNLNYLLGRMSLVVQEFNMIKSGLGEALVSLKDSFNELEDIERIEKKGIMGESAATNSNAI